MKGKWRKRALTFVTAFLAGLLMSHGIVELASDLSEATTVYADSGNVVTFSNTIVEANESNLVYAEIFATGTPGSTVTVTYRSTSGTAIENVDYVGVYNTAELKIDASGGVGYTIAIKCLDDANTREKLRVYNGDNNNGRYFNLYIVDANNATIGTANRCKCYLSYNYRVNATVGAGDPILGGEVAYLDDYKDMQAKYHDGDNDISGKEHWRTWKEGVSFNNDTSKRWINTYINQGIASAYGSYVLKSIDDDKLHSTTNIHMLSGNKEFMDKYSRDEDCPGLSLYYEIEPCKSGGMRINGRAMYYISRNENPWKKDDDLVDLEELNYISPDRLQYYWIQKDKTWYSGANSIYDSVFYKTDPYNGILDYGLSIYNGNKSWDREVHNIWLFLALIDTTSPVIQEQYTEYDPISESLRVYLRFNEPVYTKKKGNLAVKINNYSTNYTATYVEGNYSDTLVYQIPKAEKPNVKITSLTYQLPSDDIADMAYRVDAYKNIQNNFVQNTDMSRQTVVAGGGIDLSKPQLAVDIASSLTPRSAINVMISANGNGETSFDSGIVYYSWDGNDYITDPEKPSSYANAHTLTSEERGSFAVTLAKNESEGILSGDYYLHALVVSQYGMTAQNTFGPYRLDGDAPEVTQLAPSVDLLTRKTFQMRVEDKPSGAGIDSITAIVKYKDAEKKDVTSELLLVKDGVEVSSLKTIPHLIDEAGYTILEYRSNIDENDDTIPLDNFILNLMAGHPRLVIDISFRLVDVAGNKATTSTLRTVYDKRALFEYTVAAPASYAKDASLDVGVDVYNISSATGSDGITFNIEDPDVRLLVDEGATFSVTVNGDQEFVQDPYSVSLKGLEAGYYEAVGRIYGTSGGTEVDMVSKSYSFYLTNGMDDATINKQKATGNLVLSNRVYQFEDTRYYYFRTSDSSVGTLLYGATLNPDTGKYDGGSASPAFSSTIEAKKYIKYMEYQDLELISLTDSIASLLNSNSGSTIYVKAAKETRNAIQGQLWIRYKKSNWTDVTGPSGWAYYYYGEGRLEDGININGLSANLSAAIDTVTNRIVSEGADRYLVGEDYTDRLTAAPYLQDAQIHVDRETVETTMNGGNYVTNPVYPGDAAIYQNSVTIEDNKYPLATNLALEIGPSTSLYFKHVGAPTWTRIDAPDGTILKKALGEQATGLYTIREYGEGGVSEFTVYIDHTLPQLEVIVNEGLADQYALTLDGTVTTITCKNMSLQALVGEVDTQAYVAIYSYTRRSLIKVLYASDIKNYSLADGNFYVQVGDRSGNVVTYTVWTSESTIDLSVAENESKSAIVVRVNNREESEIYSYEVYLNETLIDSEFAAYKIYRGAGLYRIEIIDVYGNHESTTITHENPSPEMTWYYLNDNGGYSVYDPNRPVKMVLEDDENSQRTTNVYASAMVRVLFNNVMETDDIEFEITGVESGDYSYNSSTGLLSINTLSNWRLRVWYKNQPENDHTYVFNIDADAPEISGNFIGTGYHPTVVYDENGDVVSTSTFDSINVADLEKGTVLNLDTLTHDADGQATLTLHDGDVISGSRIVLQFTDASGVRSFTVTRNGVAVEAQLDASGNLILNGYGKYVVTVIDNLGNTATFTFVNIETDISLATLDGNELEQDKLSYGHDALEVTTLYAGTSTILVTASDGSHTYEFHYEDKTLTYGQYFVQVEAYEEEGELIEDKFAEYAQAKGFALNSDSGVTQPNVWYTAIEHEEFLIAAMIDGDGNVRFRVLTKGPAVTVEFRHEIGRGHLPNHYVVALCNESPTLTLLTGGIEVEQIASLQYIYITDDLTIKEDDVSENIAQIAYVFSETEIFDATVTIYEDGTWKEHLLGQEFGYYKIIVTNKYGNETVYVICKIEAFASVVTVYWVDGSSVTYKTNDGVIYANKSIALTVFSTEVRFEIDGQIYYGEVDGGATTLTLVDDGHYNVRAVGTNGIFELFEFEIKSDADFLYDEAWIIGYNEEALYYDRGYTNTLCSVVVGEDVVYIDMAVNDEPKVVLYDAITDQKRIDPEALKKAIGRYGVGKYTIGFRNKYGDLVTKSVHYNNIPSIVLNRQILSDPGTTQVYDLGLAIAKGFYSNNLMFFTTTSEKYVFTINGIEYRLDEPKYLEFSNNSGNGYFSYTVTYLDEYGNYVTFNAILLREDVEFDYSTMHLLTVNNVIYTRDDICITFDEELKATLSVDGGEAKDYTSGEVRYADGNYRFVVRDIAGNNVSFDVVHKSANHYSLTASSTGEDVIDGGVVNNSNVNFRSEDGSYIKFVIRNGELVPEYNSNTFNLTGHYEVLIEDQVGNQSYEEFYVLNNSLAIFNYKAPFEYEVTEVWRINPDGSKDIMDDRGASITLSINGDYLVVVTSTKTASSFNFSVAIDNTPPTAVLNGVEEGGVTARDVTITGTRSGDVVKIYRDGELISTTTVTLSDSAPAITTGGKYRVTITNVQGVTITYNFIRKSVTNVPGSIFIIVFSVLVVTAVSIGLTYHTKLKTDA